MKKAMQGYWNRNGWNAFMTKPKKSRKDLPNGIYRNCWHEEGKETYYAKVHHVNNPKIPRAFKGTNIEEVHSRCIEIDGWKCIDISLLQVTIIEDELREIETLMILKGMI